MVALESGPPEKDALPSNSYFTTYTVCAGFAVEDIAVENGRLLLTILTPSRVSVRRPAHILSRCLSDKEVYRSCALDRYIHRSRFFHAAGRRCIVHRCRSTNLR